MYELIWLLETHRANHCCMVLGGDSIVKASLVCSIRYMIIIFSKTLLSIDEWHLWNAWTPRCVHSCEVYSVPWLLHGCCLPDMLWKRFYSRDFLCIANWFSRKLRSYIILAYTPMALPYWRSSLPLLSIASALILGFLGIGKNKVLCYFTTKRTKCLVV